MRNGDGLQSLIAYEKPLGGKIQSKYFMPGIYIARSIKIFIYGHFKLFMGSTSLAGSFTIDVAPSLINTSATCDHHHFSACGKAGLPQSSLTFPVVIQSLSWGSHYVAIRIT